MVHFVMSEDDVRHVMRHPLATFGSDGWVLTPEDRWPKASPTPAAMAPIRGSSATTSERLGC